MIPPIRTTADEEISYLKSLLARTLPILEVYTPVGDLDLEIKRAINAIAPRPR